VPFAGHDQGGIGDILSLEWLFNDPLFRLPAETTRLILMLRYGDGIAEHTYPFVTEAELLTPADPMSCGRPSGLLFELMNGTRCRSGGGGLGPTLLGLGPSRWRPTPGVSG
jgi:hypothetical protein